MRVKVLLPALSLLAGAFSLPPIKLIANQISAFHIDQSAAGVPWYEKFFKEYQTILLAVLLLIVAVVVVLLVRRVIRKKPAEPVVSEPAAFPDADRSRKFDQRPAAQGIERQALQLQGNIEVYVNDQKLSTYPITDKPITIGRDPAKAVVVIQEPIVSKLHCTIFSRGEEVLVKDNESTNGTYVNEKRISEQTLADNDTITLGRKGNIKIRVYR